MPSNSSSTAIPTYRKVLLDQIKNSRTILSFDPFDFELKPFSWPVNSGKRVMSDTRHKFKGLHCLCPLLRTTDEELPFTEAKILLKDSGEYIGEYVAECPNGRCEYLVSLEQKYGIPEKTHAPKEVANIDIPEANFTSPSIDPPTSAGSSRPLKRTYAVADLTDSSTIPRATKWTKFNKLDRMRKPGLSEAEFQGLFVKCENCQKITTREVFRHHLEACKGDKHEEDTDTDTDASESEQEM